MKTRIALIGRGHVGSALQRGFDRTCHETRAVGRDPNGVRETTAWGDVVVLAVPFAAVDETLHEMGSAIGGKVLVDTTNALTPDHRLALGFTTSGAEELQRKAPAARVVKAFNTVFAEHMADGEVKGTPLTLLAAGDDDDARRRVLRLAGDIGFDPVDAGPLANARWLETLGYLNIQLGYAMHMGTDIGFRLVH